MLKDSSVRRRRQPSATDQCRNCIEPRNRSLTIQRAGRRALHLASKLFGCLVWWAVSSHRFLAIWILLRWLPQRPFYRLVPWVYTLSAAIHFVFATVLGGTLATLVLAFHSSWIAAAALVAIFLFTRRRYGPLPSALLLAGLLCLPILDIEIGFRIALGLACGLVGVLTWWERRAARRQYFFKPLRLTNVAQGSARILKGDVKVLHIFLNTSRKWRPKQRKKVLVHSNQALEWLVDQAHRYKVPLRFDQQVLAQVIDPPPVVPDADDDLADHRQFAEWLDKVLVLNGVRDGDLESSNACLLVHVSGRLNSCSAYAIPAHRFTDHLCAIEYAVVGIPHRPSAIAHELLHLFGADDYYLAAYHGENYRELPTRQQILDKCIMFAAKSDIRMSSVDDLAAQNIGWM